MATKQLTISATVEITDILMAELSEIGFDIFEDTSTGMNAYCPMDVYDADSAHEIITRYQVLGPIDVTEAEIEKQNWNAVWETNYDPIRISDQVNIRASFHEPDPTAVMDIVINPKMSFGTGHHETTTLMVQAMFEISLEGNSVLDVGTGTGILAFIAMKLGASRVHGFDIDPWSVENSIENAALNDCEAATFREGTIRNEPLSVYDVVIANINRNILLDEIAEYALRLASKGYLFLSGFYAEDIPHIKDAAHLHGLQLEAETNLRNWACLRLRKD
jgi:ribosomal protein L11 methyltransferase